MSERSVLRPRDGSGRGRASGRHRACQFALVTAPSVDGFIEYDENTDGIVDGGEELR